MKKNSLITGLAAGAAIVLASGCNKQEPAAGVQTPKSNDTAVVQPAKPADTVAAPAQQAADQAAAQAAAQATATQEQAQGLIDKAQGLLKEKKYQDALSTLGQLANVKLTPEQQKLVDDLKAQIQNAMAKSAASDASSALGGALGGKK